MKTLKRSREQECEFVQRLIARMLTDPEGERAMLTKTLRELEDELVIMERVRTMLPDGELAKGRKAIDSVKAELIFLDLIGGGHEGTISTEFGTAHAAAAR